ncbi:MAG: hypothetical protein A4E60_02628 [Syntrophorhabdus sp. PtaB.Bin047]|nr:MAG: hypothetical protein A4E60_02628 [Syntrophorhabdus sp. PtaB.Bin047]
MLLSMPAVPAIMTALVENPEGIEESSIELAGDDPERLEEALDALARRGLIVRHSGLVSLPPGGKALTVARKIVAAFSDLKSLTEGSFMIRGVLSATEYYRCLVHRDTMFAILAEDGADRQQLARVLAAEERQGYVENIDIAYRVRGGVKEKFFPFIPHHHYDDFVFMHSRAVQNGQGLLGGPAITVVKERYLLANHPPSIAEQARRYMRENKPHILSRVRNEAFDIIWWYDRY